MAGSRGRVQDWRFLRFLVSLVIFLAVRPLVAGDWPQILGPHRNGQADGETLLDKWPEGGPKQVWRVPLGMGYAGPAVAGDRVVIFHRSGAVERVESLDVNTGKVAWTQNFPARYRGGVDSDVGPRCVPLIHESRVFVFGAAGDLHALDRATGKTLWSRTLVDDYEAPDGYFGAGSTPVMISGKLLVNVGGKGGSGIVALAPDTGKTIWKGFSDAASYSSPTELTIGGRPHALFVTRLHVVCVNAEDGSEVFRFPFGQRGPTVNAATPLIADDHLFVTASYGVGAVYSRFENSQVKSEWANDDSLSSQYATPVIHEGFLYGTHGREDQGQAEFRCVDLKSGRVRWSHDGLGVCNVILAGNRLLILSAQGKLVIAEATPEKFSPLATASVSQHVTRALPALAGGRLFFRENDGSAGQLRCLAVGAP